MGALSPVVNRSTCILGEWVDLHTIVTPDGRVVDLMAGMQAEVLWTWSPEVDA